LVGELFNIQRVALIGCVPFAEEIKVPLNRLVALVFVDAIVGKPFVAVIVQLVQTIEPDDELFMHPFELLEFIFEFDAVIPPVLELTIATEFVPAVAEELEMLIVPAPVLLMHGELKPVPPFIVEFDIVILPALIFETAGPLPPELPFNVADDNDIDPIPELFMPIAFVPPLTIAEDAVNVPVEEKFNAFALFVVPASSLVLSTLKFAVLDAVKQAVVPARRSQVML
jgi:hypothetical protein